MHTMATTYNTQEEFEQVMSQCRNLFADKLHDYGAAWRVLRTETLTDQLFIKAARIRSIQTKGCSMVDEGIARFATGEQELTPEAYAAWLDALREEFSAMSGALLAGLLLGGNFLFWLDDRLLGRFAPRAAALCARWEKKHR